MFLQNRENLKKNYAGKCVFFVNLSGVWIIEMTEYREEKYSVLKCES